MSRITCHHDASDACEWIKNEQTGEFEPHVKRYGIGFGQAGYWGNKHFATLERATVEYEKHVRECHESYAKGGKYVALDVDLSKASPSLLRAVRFVNVKKNGKHGKIVHTLHLYRIDWRSEADVEAIRRFIPAAR